MADNLVMPVARIHLARLRSHLVVLGPVLFRSNSMEMACSPLVGGAIKVHTLLDVIVDMQSVDRELCTFDQCLRIGKVLLESINDVHAVRASGVVGDP